jgi:hypothetical protein
VPPFILVLRASQIFHAPDLDFVASNRPVLARSPSLAARNNGTAPNAKRND